MLILLMYNTNETDKKVINLGEVTIGDKLYIDAETFLDVQFKKNTEAFVYPFYQKSELEMISVPDPEFTTKIPETCSDIIMADKRGIIFSCKDSIKVYDRRRNSAVIDCLLPQDMICSGYVMIENEGSILTFCKEKITPKKAKVSIRKIDVSFNYGECSEEISSIEMNYDMNKFKHIKDVKINGETYSIVYSKSNPLSRRKIDRFYNNQLILVNIKTLELQKIEFAQSSEEEMIANINLITFYEVDDKEEEEVYFTVFVKGLQKKHFYMTNKSNRYYECIWKPGRKIDRCREILIDNELINGNVLRAKYFVDNLREERKLKLYINDPQVDSSIRVYLLGYKYDKYSEEREFRKEFIFIKSFIYLEMKKNQYLPVFMKNSLIFFKNKFDTKYNLAFWKNTSDKRWQIKYFSAFDVYKLRNLPRLCIFSIGRKFECFAPKSDAYIRADLSKISVGYQRYDFYLNLCQNYRCRNSVLIDIRAKISKPLTLQEKNYLDNEVFNITSYSQKSGWTFLLNSRRIVKRSNIKEVIENSFEDESENLQVLKFSEVKFWYLNPKTQKEEVIGKGDLNFNLGNVFLDCYNDHCILYQTCLEYKFEKLIEKVCKSKKVIKKLTIYNVSDVYRVMSYLVILVRGYNSGIHVIDLRSRERVVFLNNRIKGLKWETAISINGFEIIISSLNEKTVNIFKINIRSKIQTLLFSKKLDDLTCPVAISSKTQDGLILSIFSQCNEPAAKSKFWTITSPNFKKFNVNLFIPKVKVFENPDLKGFCHFSKGLYLITGTDIYFLSPSINIIYIATPENYGDILSVTCMRNDLLAIKSLEQIRIYDANQFFSQRMKNAITYNIPDGDFILDSRDGEFQVTSRKNARTLQNHHIIYWKNIEFMAFFKTEGIKSCKIITGLNYEQPISLNLDIRLPKNRRRNLYITKPEKKLNLANQNYFINIEQLITARSPYWRIVVRDEDFNEIDCIKNRGRFKILNKNIQMISWDSIESRMFFTYANNNGRSTLASKIKGDNGYFNHFVFDGLCNKISQVRNSKEILVFVSCLKNSETVLYLVKEIEETNSYNQKMIDMETKLVNNSTSNSREDRNQNSASFGKIFTIYTQIGIKSSLSTMKAIQVKENLFLLSFYNYNLGTVEIWKFNIKITEENIIDNNFKLQKTFKDSKIKIL